MRGLEIFINLKFMSGTGMIVMAIPIFTGKDDGKTSGDSVANRTEYYTTAKNLLTSGADAMERLMTAYKVSSIMNIFYLITHRLPRS